MGAPGVEALRAHVSDHCDVLLELLYKVRRKIDGLVMFIVLQDALSRVSSRECSS